MDTGLLLERRERRLLRNYADYSRPVTKVRCLAPIPWDQLPWTSENTERCGFVTGVERHGWLIITRFDHVMNLSIRSLDHFAISLGQELTSWSDLRHDDEEVLGTWHTHNNHRGHGPEPTDDDLEGTHHYRINAVLWSDGEVRSITWYIDDSAAPWHTPT